MTLASWSFTRVALVMVAWIVLVALVGPHFGAAPTKWTMTGSDGTVQMWGYTRSASRELYLAVAATSMSSLHLLPNKRLKLTARVDCGMNSFSARRSLSAIR